MADYEKDGEFLVVTESKSVVTRHDKNGLLMERQICQDEVVRINERVEEIDALLVECEKLGL